MRRSREAARGVERLESRLMLAADVIINEIMYHAANPATPGQAAIGEEYIELYNKGNQSANLTGWHFDRGIDYMFGGGTLAAGAYLVVAADLTKFNAKYPGVIAVGPWTGRLSNSGEEIRLVDNVGGTVDAVTYADEGDWAVRRKGVFSTQNVVSITRSGSTATVTLPLHGYDTGDLIQISGATQAAYNGQFTVTNYTPNTFTYTVAGSPATPATGTITASQVNDNGHAGWTWVQAADGDGPSLELVNKAITNNEGQNWKSSTAPYGTPGAVNSVNAANIAPMILDLAHTPVIPKSTDSVTVTSKIVDEVGASNVTLFYRNDGAGSFDSLAMNDAGVSGDLVAGDGTWSGLLSPQPDKTIVEFYVSASDGTLSRTMPGPSDNGGGQGANALYQVDDAVYSGSAPIYRFIMTEAERAELADIGNPGNGSENNEPNSNAQMNTTFIAMDGVSTAVRYTAGARNRGHGSRDNVPNNYRLNVPSDRPYNDLTALNFNSQVVQNQIIGSAIWRMAGLAAPDTVPVALRVNGATLQNTYALVEEADSDFMQNHFPDDPQGNYYAAFRLDPTFVPEAELQYLGTDPNAYAPLYPKQTNAEINDYSDLINLTNVLNNASAATFVD
ncbi:MAG TPA: lamin tail domain-containing protein, partial [Tepidisphaeraceae bacterium]|nr:lamin tail domain-containing protein [Tepidisphaeraceae bacterium]